MSELKLNKEQKAEVVTKIQFYFEQELDQKIGQFDAEFLLDFFAEEVGVYFYNQGLYDAQTVVDERVETIRDALYEIEKPTRFRR
ncbi:MAG: DUF2164 domain-containing protein [Reinekea sp.]